jgi:KRAB domain-containing zinc finger protein
LKHEGLHTERRFKCKYCERSFHHSAHLVTHEGYHTGEKPYRCENCGQQFTMKTQLRKHTAKKGTCPAD